MVNASVTFYNGYPKIFITLAKLSMPLLNMQRIKSFAITLLMLSGLTGLAFLSQRYTAEIDLTANHNNTLSAETRKLLDDLKEPVQITAYIKTGLPQRKLIKELIDRYRHQKSNISLEFVDPELNLEKVRELNIGSQGLIIVEYHGRSERISFLDEFSLTNALLQLAHTNQRWVSFLSGHGERSVGGKANFDLSNFANELARRNINVQSLNLAEIQAIPDNSAVLVLAAPRVPLLAGEVTLIQDYLEKGGNLLWLSEPDEESLSFLEQALGIKKLPGTIVDNSSKVYGIDDPSFVLIGNYQTHAITQGLQTMTVYPGVSALSAIEQGRFKTTPLLSTPEKALPIAYTLTRNLENKPQQRIVVIGDGDFLSNAFLGNVGNIDMGLRLFNWLTHDDEVINIPVKISIGKSLQLSNIAVTFIGFGFLMVLPLTLLGSGIFIWRKRKQR